MAMLHMLYNHINIDMLHTVYNNIIITILQIS